MKLKKLDLKKITEGDGNYYISSSGLIVHKKGKSKILKPWAKNNGSPYIYLFLNGKRKKYSVNSLMGKYWPELTVKTVYDLIKELQCLKPSLKRLPIVVNTPNGLQFEAIAKMVLNNPDDIYSGCKCIIITYND